MMRRMWVAAGFPRQHAVSVHSLSHCETLQACWSGPIRRPPFKIWLAGVGWGYNDISLLWHHMGLLVHTLTLSLGTLFVFNMKRRYDRTWGEAEKVHFSVSDRTFVCWCVTLLLFCVTHMERAPVSIEIQFTAIASLQYTVNYIFRTKCLWYMLKLTGLRC